MGAGDTFLRIQNLFHFEIGSKHKRIWMCSLVGPAVANDALITELSVMERLFALIIHPFFALISINLELQGGPVPPRPPTKYVYGYAARRQYVRYFVNRNRWHPQYIPTGFFHCFGNLFRKL